MIYKDILYTLYELRFQGDQAPFQDSNFKKTLSISASSGIASNMFR